MIRPCIVARSLTLACFVSTFVAGLAPAQAQTDLTPPIIIGIDPPPGTVNDRLEQITVTFSEPVAGVDLDDLVINGGLPAIGFSQKDNSYTFTFVPPTYGSMAVTWQAGHMITDMASPPNAFNAAAPGATWQYRLVDTLPPKVKKLFPAPGATVRSLSQVEVAFSEDVQGVEASDLLINGQAALALITLPGGHYTFQFAAPVAGTVKLAWADAHGITDLAATPHPFAGGTWTLQVDPSAVYGNLVINEILAANQNGLQDEDSTAAHPQPQDWIEIYNRGTEPVNLAGWSLSDDDTLPGVWVFPAKTLGAGEYLVVFASGKDRRAPTGANRFHTNFKLSRTGEFLGLYTPDSPRVLVSSFSPKYPEQRNDISYGLNSDGTPRYFATPTPGVSNGTSTISSACEPVHFSVSRGFFTTPFDLYLTTTTPGSLIRYSTNGTEPTLTSGAVYAGPVRVTATKMFRAAAFKADFLSSKITTHTYLFNQSAAVRSLPAISIVTASNNLTGPTGIIGIGTGYDNPNLHGVAWERPISAELIRPEDNSGFQIDCGLRVQGSDYTRPRYAPDSKFSYRFYFRGAYGPGRLDYPFFADSALQSFDQIVLRAGHNDETNPFLTDELARQLHTDMGQVACHGNFVHLFINGVWKGYYNPTERVEYQFLQSWHGGSDQWDVLTVGSTVQSGDAVAWNALLAYVRGQNVLLPAVYQEISHRLDLTNFVDYLFLNVYGATWDWPHNNWRAARERTPNGLFRFYVWDAEGAFNTAGGHDPSFNALTSSDSALGEATGTSEIADLFNKLRSNPEFRLLWADRVHKHFFNTGALVETNITSRFIAMRAELLASIPGLFTYIQTTWIPTRRAYLTRHLTDYKLFASSNAPVLNQFGGPVPRGFNLTLTNRATNAVIYYTLNGVDPRIMFSNTVAPTALAYSNSIPLNDSTTLQARTLQNATNWSALVSTTFEVATRGVPLRITEIMYNPVGGSPYEFVELQNVGTAVIDLSGMSFSGVSFRFPEGSSLAGGARLVLGSDTDPLAFAARYPGVVVAGHFGGSLNNAGERLALSDRNGQVIVSVDYQDGNGWPTEADGGGSSLEIVDPYANPDDPANWRASAQVDGTPGGAPAAVAVPDVQLNEVMAENLTAVPNGGTHPDWIELYNGGANAVNLAGWSLTDDGNARKFAFPAGTSLPASGYLVVWCDDAASPTPGLHSGFGLSRSGESLFLYDPAGQRVDAVSFGFQLADYSIGRLGGAWRLTTPTPAALNIGAPVAASTNLVINEWLANPLPGSDDWVELYNRSTTEPAALQGVYLGTSNAVQQLTSLSFIPPGGYVQLHADEGVGPDHLDFKLPATAGAIILYDEAGAELQRVRYGAQAVGVTQGRLPDGSSNIVSFPGTASPAAMNYTVAYAGPILNEVMAINRSAVTNAAGLVSDWIELFNPNGASFDLSGMSLSLDGIEPGQWLFPFGTSIPANGYLLLWCDGLRAASVVGGANLNTGRSLNGESGGVYLFNSVGQLVDAVEYGFQLEDMAIGRVGNQWRLLAAATPGATNGAVATLGLASAIRFNEWMANPWSGSDWFELYNTGNQPVDLGGSSLSDHPASVGTNQFRVAPLSFIPANGWVKWVADGQPDVGRNHVNFVLNADGESLRLYGPTQALIDAVYYGYQSAGISEGRLPDGSTNTVRFPGSPTPGEGNYQVLGNVVINELLANPIAPQEEAIELFNPSATPLAIGGWYLSNLRNNDKKFRIPDGTLLPANGFKVFYEAQFNDRSPTAFALDRVFGGEVWLSAADADGNLTGGRTGAAYGPSQSGVSFGRYETVLGVDYVAMSRPSFGVDSPGSVAQFRTGNGGANPAPKVGPVVLTEILYHPSANVNPVVEYLELENISGQPISLWAAYDPSRTWQMRDAVEFGFPMNTTLATGGRLLVVDFDPVTSPATLAAFRNAYGIPGDVAVLGPFSGKLGNNGDDVKLFEPALPQPGTGYVPYTLVDRVRYTGEGPWPAGAVDGGGLSLQRRAPALYGNDPENWVAAWPTPGAANGAAIQPPPSITVSPESQPMFLGMPGSLGVVAGGAGPLSYQWRFNGQPLSGATNAALHFDQVRLDDAGTYDVFVSNAGGAVFSEPATLVVRVPLTILAPPQTQAVKAGTAVTFSVFAMGDPPLSYQWRSNGVTIPGANSSSLTLANVSLAQNGDYTVIIANSTTSLSATATLSVLVPPVITQQPQPVTVVAGKPASFSAVATGTLPMGFRWRRNGITIVTYTVNQNYSIYTIPSAQLSQAGNYSVSVTNVISSGVLSATVALTVLADIDGDQIPDVWEAAHGLDPINPADAALDPDGDRMTNLQEYMAGTDPQDGTSYLKVEPLAVASGLTTIQFNAVSNKTYRVLYSDEVAQGVWLTLTNVLSRPTNRLETIIDPAGHSRFYRLATPAALLP